MSFHSVYEGPWPTCDNMDYSLSARDISSKPVMWEGESVVWRSIDETSDSKMGSLTSEEIEKIRDELIKQSIPAFSVMPPIQFCRNYESLQDKDWIPEDIYRKYKYIFEWMKNEEDWPTGKAISLFRKDFKAIKPYIDNDKFIWEVADFGFQYGILSKDNIQRYKMNLKQDHDNWLNGILESDDDPRNPSY